MTDEERREAIRRAREIVGPDGFTHAAWDIIQDAEAHAAGKPQNAIIRDPAMVDQMLTAFLEQEDAKAIQELMRERADSARRIVAELPHHTPEHTLYRVLSHLSIEEVRRLTALFEAKG